MLFILLNKVLRFVWLFWYTIVVKIHVFNLMINIISFYETFFNIVWTVANYPALRVCNYIIINRLIWKHSYINEYQTDSYFLFKLKLRQMFFNLRVFTCFESKIPFWFSDLWVCFAFIYIAVLSKTLESILFWKSIITCNDYGCFRKNFLEQKIYKYILTTYKIASLKNETQ